MILDRKKKMLVAIFTGISIISLTSSKAFAINKSSYIEDGNLIINEVNSYSVIIDEKELENAKNIRIIIDDEEVIIDSEMIRKFKEEAKRQYEELQKFEMTVYTSLGIITIIVVKTNTKIKKK